MPEYLSPGVYVEEIETGPQPITGVSTSVTGAVGVTLQGPTSGKPQLVTSFAQFQTIFGGYIPTPPAALVNQWALDANEGGQWWQFPLSVKGYFDNGGQQLYVKRVFAGGGGVPGAGATAAGANFCQGMIADVAQDATASSTTIKLSHLIDIVAGKQLNFIAAGKTIPGNPFTVVSYNPTLNTVLLNNPIGFALSAGRDYVVIDALAGNQNPVTGLPNPVPAANTTLEFSAQALGNWGNNISVRVAAMVGAAFNILPDPTTGGAAFTTTVAHDVAVAVATVPVADTSGFVAGDHARIAGVEYALSNVNAAAKTVDVTPANVPGAVAGTLTAVLGGSSVTRIRSANVAGATTIQISGASQIYDFAILQLDNGLKKETVIVQAGGVAGEVVTINPPLVNVYYEGQKVRVIEAEVDTQNTVNGVVVASEVMQNLRLHNDQTTNYIVTGVNLQSAFVNVQTSLPVNGGGYSETNLAWFPASPLASEWVPLTNGQDNLAQLTVEDFIGVDGGSGNRTGIQAMEDITDISICIVPGMWSQSVQAALINHCETLRYRFGILDPPDGLSIDEIIAFRQPLDTEYAAIYYPWVQVLDPSVVQNVDVAPSGHMAGIYAQTDINRGVFKAPANVEISMITKIAQDVNKREQDLLNPIGINALRYFPERGNRVWGARTLSSDTDWQYINVRRLFIYIEASIDQGTQWVVFEPNDQRLWARVRQTITEFLTTTWLSGALQGATPDEAFFVQCDLTTMTQDDIDNGRLICVIGIAPVRPAEFVIFRIQQIMQAPASS
jgi:phage tail sheath protein FI